MEGADFIADVAGKSAGFDEVADAIAEIFYGGIGEGDDEDFLLVLQLAFENEFGG